MKSLGTLSIAGKTQKYWIYLALKKRENNHLFLHLMPTHGVSFPTSLDFSGFTLMLLRQHTQ